MRASLERSLLEVAMPFLQDLYERTHETVHLGVREGHEVVYVAKIGGHRQANAPSRTGGRMPLHCTAIGKALLAHCDPELRREVLSSPDGPAHPAHGRGAGTAAPPADKVVETGVAFEHEESALGITCVAAPVFGPGEEHRRRDQRHRADQPVPAREPGRRRPGGRRGAAQHHVPPRAAPLTSAPRRLHRIRPDVHGNALDAAHDVVEDAPHPLEEPEGDGAVKNLQRRHRPPQQLLHAVHVLERTDPKVGGVRY